jgi:hypothetical protein
MSVDAEHHGRERLELGALGRSLYLATGLLGAVGLLACVVLGYVEHDGWRRFYHSYLANFLFFLSIALGGLFFVLIQHLTRAGWSVSTRRIAEAIAATLLVLAVLATPIAISVVVQNGQLYPWARPAASLDPLTLAKRPFLNPAFFIARLAVYFAFWVGAAVWYRRMSLKQDQSGDAELTSRMQAFSAPAMVIYAITVTLAAFDLLMSLDPHWYSTIFGVYFFAGSAVAIYAAIIAIVHLLQHKGMLRQSVTAEHYHDLGKFLFGFLFFWGYIAFSQYMLIWYANIPEETAWLRRHGMTTVSGDMTAWTGVCVAMLIGGLLVPFAGLLSRHVKRNRGAATFWAIWLLAFHYLDLYWLVMPQAGKLRPSLMDLAALVGIGGIWIAALARLLARHPLRPVRDPRLEESLAFENV